MGFPRGNVQADKRAFKEIGELIAAPFGSDHFRTSVVCLSYPGVDDTEYRRRVLSLLFR